MSAFNPYTQNITILMADGSTPVIFSVADVDAFNFYNTASCINFGAQMGASLLMFIIVLVLVKESSRWKVLHILNLLSLALSFLRSLLYAIYYVSTWDELYTAFTLDFTLVSQSTYATSIAGTVIPLLLTGTVNASLCLQAHTVCKNMGNKYRYTVSALSFIVVGLAIGFRFAQTVAVSIKIMDSENSYNSLWISDGALSTETISIWYFSIIFTGKLFWTLYIRKRQGWKQYTAVQVLALMGCCTMIIPSIFAVLEYVTTDTFPEAGSIALTMVALLLPLSSIWAGMLTDSSLPSLNLSQNTPSQYGSSSVTQRKIFGSCSSGPTSSPLEDMSGRKGSSGPIDSISPITIDSRIENVPPATRDSTEMDLEAMGVRVDRSYSVHSGRG